jgi:hypothetical protein
VLFATDSAELTPEGRAMLDRLAPCWSHGRFEIEGHTDNTGTDAINQPLSERRARAIVDQLIKDGIDASALTAKGYGSTKPVADNATPEGRAKNRRVEFRKRNRAAASAAAICARATRSNMPALHRHDLAGCNRRGANSPALDGRFLHHRFGGRADMRMMTALFRMG